MSDIEISVVIPAYNEETNIRPLIGRLSSVLEKITQNYEIIFSIDPSKDNTVDSILMARSLDQRIKMILMSRRYGQPAASIAGLSKAIGRVCVLIDADLQDPPELIAEMYSKYMDGYDIVHTKRTTRKGENLIRLAVTHFGYWLINKLSTTDIPRNVGEYKLFSRRALDSLLLVRDKNIFIKGLVSYIGFKQIIVEYDRDPRASGEPHYSQLFGSISLSLHGLFCYSNVPLHYISFLGFISTIFSAILIFGFIIGKICGLNFASGLVTTIVVISFFSGIIIFSIGILGEYIGRIFDEVKDRPRYIIDKEFL